MQTCFERTYRYDPATGNLSVKYPGSIPTTSPNPGTTGLVAWWGMDETIAMRNDSHGSNHLTDHNSVGYATGLRGKAASFAGSGSQYLSVPDNPNISGGDVDFTIVANVYLNNNTNSFIIIDKSDYVSVFDYRIGHNPGTGFRFKVGASTYVDSGAVTANTWHTVIAWYDSVQDTINIQVDNGVVNSLTFTGGTADSDYPLAIGAAPNGGYPLNGRIDEVALYKRKLTDEERLWLYKDTQTRVQGRIYGEVHPLSTELMAYTYDTDTSDGDPAHPHAVRSLSSNNYKYDANGNQIKRVIGALTYLLAYDAENRLVQVCKEASNPGICDSSEEIAKFTYDADGKRIKSVIGSETTLFIGSHYEIANPGSGQTVTKYYFAGASRIALRKYVIPQNMTVEYLVGDHLGSTSLTTDASGVKISEIRYDAWGNIRYTSPDSQSPLSTQYTFTAQFSYMDDPTTQGTEGFGLMFYNARWYDPQTSHFSQPDTIVPDPANPQSWDRYSYARNNPLRYNDPSGHLECEAESNGSCMNSKKLKLWQYAADTLNELGGKNDLEAVARIVDRAGQLYGTFETMMPALSGIFLGIEESNSTTIYNAATQEDRCAALGRPDCAANSGITFGDAGFHQDFRDLQSQPFHFWAYVATAANTEGVGPASYLPGMVVNAVANVYHEIIQPDGAGATWQDFALAAAGSNIGTLVNIGAIQPNQLGNTIRDHIGGSGPGAFYVDPLIFLLPLEGNR